MNICAVIVTYNRHTLLQKVLDTFDILNSPPDSIIIVDNHSTDQTPYVISQWKKKTNYKKTICIRLAQNGGGSGGFHAGIQEALTLRPDWIWLSDDDAIPDHNCFSVIKSKLAEINPIEYSAICCSVINKGQIDENHRRRLCKTFLTIKEKNVAIEEYTNPLFTLDLFSYVGTMVNVKKLIKAGLPDKDYFVWHDDFEHSWRLSLHGKIICLPQAKIYHDTIEDDQLTWKSYYGLRNKLLMFKNHHYISYLKQVYLLKKKIYLSSSLRQNPVYKTMLIAAVSDAIRGKKGLHSVYKPGWSAHNK